MSVRKDNKDTWEPCPMCAGGFVVCTLCGGSQRIVRVDVRFVTDRTTAFEQWLIPHEASMATTALRSMGPAATAPEYACDLASTVVESAYRGAASMVTPAFHGFELLDAAERARDALAQAQTTLHAAVMQCFGVPFFLVQYQVKSRAIDVVVRRAADGTHIARLA
jgi:hypothetical protein